MPGVKVRKTKEFSGTGGRGYWNLKYYDQKGRMILQEKYRKRILMSRNAYEYNVQNDEVLSVSLYDINYPGKVDTISVETYEYDESGQAILNKSTIGKTVITTRKTASSLPNMSEYHVISEHYWQEKDIITYDTTTFHVILNNKNFIEKKIRRNRVSGEKEITDFEYFDNGKLKRTKVTRIPVPEYPVVYTGGPRGDDMSYKYKYNKKGRVKKLYTIVEGKKYKLEEYTYKEW
jgi:hypothetical protein